MLVDDEAQTVARPDQRADSDQRADFLPPEAIRSVVQPIVRLDDRVVVGYEALARVDLEPYRSPDEWLHLAAAAGHGIQLEAAFLASAARLGPPPADRLLFVNASPGALSDPALFSLRDSLPERLVVELTEQAAVDDYGILKNQLAPWIDTRVRFAIDDTGAGYSSLRHVVELAPDFLKLDRTLVHGVDKDGHRNALIRALVAFAREVGTSVIAEGIETQAELAALVSAEVTLGQGYLFGRPAEPWPAVTDPFDPRSASDRGSEAALRIALSKARTVAAACDAVVAHLFRWGQMMPSLYLEQNGRLRCVAQRGLWQVLDGLPRGAGVTGRVWDTGEPIEARDVSLSPDYLEAVPGVVSEICVPVVVGGEVIGALNVDSLSPLPTGTLRKLQNCAVLLSRRLSVLGWRAADSAVQRAVHGSIAISDATADEDAAAQILATFLTVSRMDSAGLVRVDGGRPYMQTCRGPLAPALEQMSDQSLQGVCKLVEGLNSCYTGTETTGLPYLGSDSLRAGGARATIFLPLRANNTAIGVVLLANSRPMRLAAELVEPLELLAGQAAATLNTADLVDQLRRQAQRDGLTGVYNRAALNDALVGSHGDNLSILMVDVDHFKKVNDQYGHPTGDEALRSLADALTTALPEAAIYRMGGDEFAVLLPDVDAASASRSADTVRRAGERALAPWSTSISIGGATSFAGETPEQTLARADAALLRAKARSFDRLKPCPPGFTDS